MNLAKSKYLFRYYHKAECALCGTTLMEERQSNDELRAYRIPYEVRSLIETHLRCHQHYGLWDLEYEKTLHKIGTQKWDKIVLICYKVRIDSESAFIACQNDLQNIFNEISINKIEAFSNKEIEELKKIVSNNPFTIEQKKELKTIIDKIDDISTQINRIKRSQEIIESSHSAYYTQWMGLPGLGKKA